MEWCVAGIIGAVHGLKRCITGLVLFQYYCLTISLDFRGTLDNNPMLGPVVVVLAR